MLYEGTNSKLNKTFETHPQFYKFVLLVIEELDNLEEKVLNILDGVTKPRETERTKELKEDREAQKKLLIERCDNPNATENDIDEEIDRFMGKTGSISTKVGMEKVVSDYADVDLLNEAIVDGEEVGDHLLTFGQAQRSSRGRGSGRRGRPVRQHPGRFAEGQQFL